MRTTGAFSFVRKHTDGSPVEGSFTPLSSQHSPQAPLISMLQDEIKLLRKRLQFATEELKRRDATVTQQSPSQGVRTLTTKQVEVEEGQQEKATPIRLHSPELERRRSFTVETEAALMTQCRALADQLRASKLEMAQLRKDLVAVNEDAGKSKVNAESASSAKEKLEHALDQAARELQSMEIELDRSNKKVDELTTDNRELRRNFRRQEESLRELQTVNERYKLQIADLESKIEVLLGKLRESNVSNEDNPSAPASTTLPSQDEVLMGLRKELENKSSRVSSLSKELEEEKRRVAELQRQVWDQAVEIDDLHSERRKTFGTTAEVVRLRNMVETLEEALRQKEKGVLNHKSTRGKKGTKGKKEVGEDDDVFDDVFELYSGARGRSQTGIEETWLMDVNRG